VELEVIERDKNSEWFRTAGGSLIWQQDTDWEVVPTETWRDVTAECEVHNNGMQIDHFVHGEPGHYGIIRVMGNDNQRDGSFLPYRIAKVPVCREGGFVDCGKCDMWAFIVEKREP
jgi:hypothetical protein